jgi:hypothetical protein
MLTFMFSSHDDTQMVIFHGSTALVQSRTLLRGWPFHFSGILNRAQNLSHPTDTLHKIILTRSSVGHKWR